MWGVQTISEINVIMKKHSPRKGEFFAIKTYNIKEILLMLKIYLVNRVIILESVLNKIKNERSDMK